MEREFSPEFIRASAQRFGLERFKEEFMKFAAVKVAEFQDETGGLAQDTEAAERVLPV